MTLTRLGAAAAVALPLAVHGLSLHLKGGEEDAALELHAASDEGARDLPTAQFCVIILCCQYVLIYTSLALVRTYAEVMEVAKGVAESSLAIAARTVAYSPMLCVLFIACRMRVAFLTDNKEHPPVWVQRCMVFATFSLVGQSILVLLVPFVTGHHLPLPREKKSVQKLEEELEEKEEDQLNTHRARDEVDDDDAFTGGTPCFMRFAVFRYAIMLGLYGGIAGVVVGTITYLPPGEKDLRKLPAPAPAVMCSMILAVLFFGMELVVVAGETYSAWSGKTTPKLTAVMTAAINTTAFAPMLAIVFLAARMRALQHGSQPTKEAQDAMYASTAALAVTTMLAVIVPFFLHGEVKTDPVTNETTIEVPAAMKYVGYGLVAMRYCVLVGMYGGTGYVIYSIYKFESPKGPEHTVPVSPAVQCVVILCVQYFFIYFCLNVMHTAGQVTGGNFEHNPFFAALQKAKATVAFAPMLAVLFVATRSYALFLTDNKGAPQRWCQDGMFMATWSCLLAFLICLATGVVMGEVKVDEDGNIINKFSNWYAGMAFTVARYLTMLMLYGGMITVVVGLCLMTPETANGRGSIPYVTDTVNKTPVGDPPALPEEAVSFLGLTSPL